MLHTEDSGTTEKMARDSAAPAANDDSAAPAANSAAPAASNNDYRLDLDGLRGVAIALVVAFHVWFGVVSGGVDIFLVLSGFFFTGMLLRQGEKNGTIRLWDTARRTARRLLPALFVVLAVGMFLITQQRPYTQWSDLAGQTLASGLYYQNWYLADAAADYLAADPNVSPMQHLWSMAVQGQFYLAIVLLLWLVVWGCRRAGRLSAIRPTLGILTLVLGVASFIYAAILSGSNQEWAYYDSGARAWELLAGALLAVVVPLLRTPDRIWARIIRSLLAVIGMAGVITCGMLFDGAQEFPGPAALFPVGAAVLLILAGAKTTMSAWRPAISRMLATKPFVELGEIAYSLYLWHWPLLIYYLFETGQSDLNLFDGLLIISASLVLAVATNRLVEEPLRLRSGAASGSPLWLRRGAAVAVSLVGVAIFGSIGVWQTVVWTTPKHPVESLDRGAYPGAEALLADAIVPEAKWRPSVLEAPADLPAPTVDGCIADWQTIDVVTCEYGDPLGTRTLALVGNSHAEHWLPALQMMAEARSIKIVVYLKMGCPLNIREDAHYRGMEIPDCRDWSRAVMDQLDIDRPDWVFTTATAPVWPIGGDEVPLEFLDVWARMAELDLNVLAVRDTPWLRNDLGQRYRGVDCLAGGGTPDTCGMNRVDALSPENPAQEWAEPFDNIHLLDLSDALCGPEVCRVVEGNVLVYHDEHHLTATYVRTMTSELDRQIGAATGWW